MKAEWTNKDSLTSGETTKAILVIDMPKSCYKCPMMFDDGNGIWCGVERDKDGDMHMRVHYYCDENGRASWCPLKPMPKKLQFQEPFNDDYTVSWASRLGFVDGWNACIEEIEK